MTNHDIPTDWTGPHPMDPRGAASPEGMRAEMPPPMLDPAFVAHHEAQNAAREELLRKYIDDTLEKRVSRIAVFGEAAAAVTRAAAAATGIRVEPGSTCTVEPGFPNIANPERAHAFVGMTPGRNGLASDFVRASQGSEPDRWTLTLILHGADGREEKQTVHEFTDPTLVRAFTVAHYADTQYAQLADLQGIDDPDVAAACAAAVSAHGPLIKPLAEWATLAAARQVVVVARQQALDVTHGALTQNTDLQQVRDELKSERTRIDNALAGLEPELNTVLAAVRLAFSDVGVYLAAYRDRADRTAADVEQDAIDNARAALATVRPFTENLPVRAAPNPEEKTTGAKSSKAAEGRVLA